MHQIVIIKYLFIYICKKNNAKYATERKLHKLNILTKSITFNKHKENEVLSCEIIFPLIFLCVGQKMSI